MDSRDGGGESRHSFVLELSIRSRFKFITLAPFFWISYPEAATETRRKGKRGGDRGVMLDCKMEWMGC